MVQKVPNLIFKTTSAHPVKAAVPAANRLLPVLFVTGAAAVVDAVLLRLLLLLLPIAATVVEAE